MFNEGWVAYKFRLLGLDLLKKRELGSWREKPSGPSDTYILPQLLELLTFVPTRVFVYVTENVSNHSSSSPKYRDIVPSWAFSFLLQNKINKHQEAPLNHGTEELT